MDPILVTFGQICNVRDPNLVTFYLCIYLKLNEEHFTFHPHLKYKPHSSKTLLKMRPHPAAHPH